MYARAEQIERFFSYEILAVFRSFRRFTVAKSLTNLFLARGKEICEGVARGKTERSVVPRIVREKDPDIFFRCVFLAVIFHLASSFVRDI